MIFMRMIITVITWTKLSRFHILRATICITSLAYDIKIRDTSLLFIIFNIVSQAIAWLNISILIISTFNTISVVSASQTSIMAFYKFSIKYKIFYKTLASLIILVVSIPTYTFIVFITVMNVLFRNITILTNIVWTFNASNFSTFL